MCGWHVLAVTGVLDLNVEANVTRNFLEQLQRGREGERERERERTVIYISVGFLHTLKLVGTH